MAKKNPYYERIQQMGWKELRQLWHQIRQRKTQPEWPPGRALEYFLLRGFELEEAEVVYPFEVYRQNEIVEQIDGVVFWNNFTVLMECKDVSRAVNFDPIAKLRSRLMTRPSNVIGAFFSMAGYTIPAQIVAQHLAPQTILLWEPSDIDFSLRNRYFCKGLSLKYKKCVLVGRPDFHLDNRLADE
ncbi:MAG: hypothetical protein AAGJ82_03835 [Bacteroidota bacterium]